MGLYTSSVYGESVRVIPYIRRKVAEIERRSGFQAKAHLGKELAQDILQRVPGGHWQGLDASTAGLLNAACVTSEAHS